MSEDLISTIVLNAPSVGVLVYVVWYQSRLIQHLINSCDCKNRNDDR